VQGWVLSDQSTERNPMTTIGLDPAWDDTSRSDWYCEHGTYIGSPYGPDYLCGWCEDGISADQMRAIQSATHARSICQRVDTLTALCKAVAMQPYSALVATVLTEHIISRTLDLDERAVARARFLIEEVGQ